MSDSIASWSRGCLSMQGYGFLSDEERQGLWLGLRFSPLLCLVGIALGTALASPVLLFVMAATAMIGGFLTAKHPFDYLYDLAVRPLVGGPSVPSSPAPRRFACQLAMPWIMAIAVAFIAGTSAVAWILAAPLMLVGTVVTLTNWCLPSLIYGRLRRPRAAKTAT